jgi:hypothetical protein
MNRHINPTLGRAGAIAACAAAAGLVLAACGGSSSPSSSGTAKSPGSTSAPKSSGGSSSSSGSSSVVASNSVPFPIAVGNTWTYNSTTSLGTEQVVNKVLTVTPVSGGNQVTMSNQIGSAAPTDITYIFHADGTITYPFNQLGSDVKIISGTIEWPSATSIDAGQTSTSTVVMALTSNGSTQDITTHVTVKGEGSTSVTVPAGTYTATIVQMTESFTMLGHSSTIVVRTYMANGVGPVENEATLSLAGVNEVVADQKLVSFTQG